MEQTNNEKESATQEVSAANIEVAQTQNANITDKRQVNNPNSNLLYDESLGPTPGTPRGKQDPRYVSAKSNKQYRNFDFTKRTFYKS